jgi:hypothetical protein
MAAVAFEPAVIDRAKTGLVIHRALETLAGLHLVVARVQERLDAAEARLKSEQLKTSGKSK